MITSGSGSEFILKKGLIPRGLRGAKWESNTAKPSDYDETWSQGSTRNGDQGTQGQNQMGSNTIVQILM